MHACTQRACYKVVRKLASQIELTINIPELLVRNGEQLLALERLKEMTVKIKVGMVSHIKGATTISRTVPDNCYIVLLDLL